MRTFLALAACACAHARVANASPQPQPKQRSKRLQRETSFWASAASGGAAACAATVTFHPVDTVKTVLQSGAGGAGGMAAVRALGARGLYRGVLPAAFSMMPACAVRMGAYEVLKGALLEHAPREINPGVLVFCASALSVVASSSVRAPLDMIKTRVQADASISAASALRSAWGGGVGALYRGAGLGLMRDVPFFGCNLLIYEQLKAAAIDQKSRRARCAPSSRLRPKIATTSAVGTHGGATGDFDGPSLHPPPAVLSPLELVLIGAAAQGIAGLLTNPADVLKTRVQSGAASSLSRALRAGSAASLMRGAGMRVAWIAPQGMVYYPAYELVQRRLSRAREPKV